MLAQGDSVARTAFASNVQISLGDAKYVDPFWWPFHWTVSAQVSANRSMEPSDTDTACSHGGWLQSANVARVDVEVDHRKRPAIDERSRVCFAGRLSSRSGRDNKYSDRRFQCAECCKQSHRQKNLGGVRLNPGWFYGVSASISARCLRVELSPGKPRIGSSLDIR